jgi:hypothetical protein
VVLDGEWPGIEALLAELLAQGHDLVLNLCGDLGWPTGGVPSTIGRAPRSRRLGRAPPVWPPTTSTCRATRPPTARTGPPPLRHQRHSGHSPWTPPEQVSTMSWDMVSTMSWNQKARPTKVLSRDFWDGRTLRP